MVEGQNGDGWRVQLRRTPAGDWGCCVFRGGFRVGNLWLVRPREWMVGVDGSDSFAAAWPHEVRAMVGDPGGAWDVLRDLVLYWSTCRASVFRDPLNGALVLVGTSRCSNEAARLEQVGGVTSPRWRLEAYDFGGLNREVAWLAEYAASSRGRALTVNGARRWIYDRTFHAVGESVED